MISVKTNQTKYYIDVTMENAGLASRIRVVFNQPCPQGNTQVMAPRPTGVPGLTGIDYDMHK